MIYHSVVKNIVTIQIISVCKIEKKTEPFED